MEQQESRGAVEIRDDSVVELFPVFVNGERNRYGEQYVGGDALGGFVALPEEGVEALRMLQQGLTVGKVSQCLADEDGGGVDVVAFVHDLCELGFVRSVDGRLAFLALPETPQADLPLPALNRWPSNRVVVALCAVIAAVGVAVVAGHRQYLPRWHDFFWHESCSLILVVGFVTSWLLLAGHELAHLGMARALGVAGRFSLGTRLWYVVGQTRLFDLYRLPKRERCLIYLAGMLHDVALLALLALYLWSYDHLSPLGGMVAYRFAKAMILTLTLGLAWQFNFYMRTDVYFILADLFDCKSLFSDAKTYLLSKIPFPGDRGSLDNLPAGERRVVRLYSAILLTGTLVILFAFGLYQVPVVVTLIRDSLTNLFSQPLAQWQRSQWDSLVALALVSFNYLLLAGLLVRQRVRGKSVNATAFLSRA